MINYIVYFTILIALVLSIVLSGQRYHVFLPTFSFFYPNSKHESQLVLEAMHTRSDDDVQFFNMTDDNIWPAFEPYTPTENFEGLTQIIHGQDMRINFLKNLINRPRPNQICCDIVPLKSKTADTPAFPAGHAAQAYILASHLSKKYPDRAILYEMIADRCNDCRIRAGLHYPSDGMYAKLLFLM
jgi:hypothetical protein